MKRMLPALLVNGALLACAVASLFPLFWMVSVSLMPAGQASHLPPPILPRGATLAQYRQLFELAGIGHSLLNSALLAALCTFLSLCFNVSAGYAFAKLRFRGRERLFTALLGALVIPGQVALIPLFLLLNALGLVDTYAGVLMPSLAGVFGIFLVRQYALTLPDELLEAARIDGASELRLFVSVVLPALRPILVTLALFSFLGSWNDFLWPLIILERDELRTLPLALAALSLEHKQDLELMMAGSVVTLLPALIVFLSLQRHYMQGLLAGSIKG